MTHAGRFNGREMLAANIKDLCQLFLGISLFLAIVSDSIRQVSMRSEKSKSHSRVITTLRN